MSDSINAMSGSSAAKFKEAMNSDAIKPETRKKLEEMGIDTSKIKTETEAQQKIKEAESAQANASVQGIQASSFQHPMGEVIEDAKKLAETIGIKVTDVHNIEKFLDTIDKKIKEFEKQVKDDTDEERKNMVSGVRGVYEQIYSEYQASLDEQRKLIGNMDMLANYNKIRS